MMGRERSRDSAMVQLVLAREKASVAAAKSEISLVLGGDGESNGEVWDEVDVEVVFAVSDSVGGGVEGGVGYAGSESESGFDLSKTDMRFSSPRMLGIR
jgi:hypothetical protein